MRKQVSEKTLELNIAAKFRETETATAEDSTEDDTKQGKGK